MEFAYFAPSCCLDDSESSRETILRAREQVVLADQLGFDVIWFPEHHFSRAMSSPSPLLSAVDAAQRTRNARVGTSVIIAAYQHPLALAAEIALADHLTDGRLEVGFGRGVWQYEYSRFGVTQTEAAERTKECVQAVMGLLTQENFAHEGKYWQFPPTTIAPLPFQTPSPKLWMAARSPESVSFTIEHGLGMFITVQQEPVSRLRAQIGLVDAMVEDLERYPRPKISVSSMTYVTNDKRDGLTAMEWPWRMRLTNYRLHFEAPDANELDIDLAARRSLPDGTSYTPEEMMERLVVGDPETVVEKLKAIEAMGVDQFVVYADFGYDHEKVMRSLELFGERVMPAFEKSASRQPAAVAGS